MWTLLKEYSKENYGTVGYIIVFFKSLGDCKIHNKENFTLKSNSNKIICLGVGGQPYLVLNMVLTL